jgi:hypothetical protein
MTHPGLYFQLKEGVQGGNQTTKISSSQLRSQMCQRDAISTGNEDDEDVRLKSLADIRG